MADAHFRDASHFAGCYRIGATRITITPTRHLIGTRTPRKAGIAQLGGGPPKITMLETQEGADGWECQRAMGVANNVVADVNACGYHISDQGGQVVDKVLAKVDNE